MAADESFNVPIDIITEYVAGEANRLQQPLDDAIDSAYNNVVLEGVKHSVNVNIVPEGATVRGDSSTINWTAELAREYLRPPGDSTRFQAQIVNHFSVMGRSAANNFRVTTVIFEISP